MNSAPPPIAVTVCDRVGAYSNLAPLGHSDERGPTSEAPQWRVHRGPLALGSARLRCDEMPVRPTHFDTRQQSRIQLVGHDIGPS